MSVTCVVVFFASCEIANWPFFTPRDPGVLWVSNSADDTVSCIDRIHDKVKGTWTVGDNPSRTAVDLAGNCWVGSRNDTTVWFVTPAGRTRKFDGFNAARGVALDAKGDVWIANSGNSTIQRISVKDGTVSAQIGPVSPGYFYGALVDSHGFLWVLDQGGRRMLRYDTSRFPDPAVFESIPAPGTIYGFTIDTYNTVWIAGMDATALYRIVDGSSTVDVIPLTGQAGQIYAVVFDMAGNIWVTNDPNNRLIRYNPSDGAVSVVQLDAVAAPLEPGLGPHGLGADEEGFVYSVNRGSNNVSKVDAAACTVVATFHVGNDPYTYSDLTGFVYRNVTRKPVAP